MARMPGDPGKTKNIKAKFTDRERERDLFWDKYNEFQENINKGIENSICVLNYYGIGGVGKSTLLLEIERELKESGKSNNNNICFASYNMNDSPNKSALLEGIRKKLVVDYGFDFPIFDLANDIYKIKTVKPKSMQDFNGIISSSEIRELFYETVSAVPVGGAVIASSLRIVDVIITKAKEKYKDRKKELSQLQTLSGEDLFNDLHWYFAQDLTINMKKRKVPLVIFIDTYEKLVNEMAEIGIPLDNDRWLRNEKDGIINFVCNTIWVITGREELKWAENNENWNDELKNHEIVDLKQEDTALLLESADIHDKNIHDIIYKITNGTPVYINLCIDNYYLMERNDEFVTPNNLGNNRNELIRVFLRYMNREQQLTVYALSCLEEWREDEIDVIARDVLDIPSRIVTDLMKHSFILYDNRNYRMHQTIKEVLISECPKDIVSNAYNYKIKKYKMELSGLQPIDYEYTSIVIKYVQSYLNSRRDYDEIVKFYNNEIVSYVHSITNVFQYENACNVMEIFIDYLSVINEPCIFKGQVYNDYASCLEEGGRFGEAIYYAKIACEIYTSLNKNDEIFAIDAKNQLSIAYSRNGENIKALPLSEEVLQQSIKNLGEEHPKTIRAMNNLSIRYGKAGRYKEALCLSKTVFCIRKNKLGEEDPATIRAINNLSVKYRNVGMYKKALCLSKKVVQLRTELLGEVNPTTIIAMHNLSIDYSKVGENKKALCLSKKVIQLRTELLGEKNPATIRSKNNLSTYYSKAGKKTDALILSKKIYNLSIKILGEEHPDTIKIMNNLSVNYYNNEKSKEAICMAERVLELRNKILGENHPNTITALSNLSVYYYKTGENKDFLTLTKKALNQLEKILGKEHPFTIVAMNNLSINYSKIGKKEKALCLSQKVERITNRIYGEEHPETLIVMNNLSVDYCNNGRYKDAISLSEKVLLLMVKILGENHPNTIVAVNNLTFYQSNIEKNNEVYLLSEDVLNFREKIYNNKPEITKAQKLFLLFLDNE